MQNEDITILVDIDDTIEDLLGAWCKWLNEKHNLNVQPKDIKEWDMSKAYPTLSQKELYEPLNYRCFWDKWVKPKPDAMKYLKKLYDDGFNIYLCTATYYKSVEMKYECIVQRYFPYIKWDHVIITSNKAMIHGDFLIDDGIHNLEHGDFIKILLSASHNMEYDAATNGMFRATDWEWIYSFIKCTALLWER